MAATPGIPKATIGSHGSARAVHKQYICLLIPNKVYQLSKVIDISGDPKPGKPIAIRWLFCLLWLLLYFLYRPAAKAGFVTDFTGWLDQVQHHPFWEYVNRSNFKAVSMYQFTQLLTYVFYQLLGIDAGRWHLLFVTLQAANAALLYRVVVGMLTDGGVARAGAIGFVGALLFCLSPYLSEVIVWEPSFHFLTGLTMPLLILHWVQRYIHTGDKKYVRNALILYALSLFSLELFYATPWLVLALALFYRFNPVFPRRLFGNIVLWFFLPMLALFVMRIVGFRVIYGSWVSRIGTDAVTAITPGAFGKPIKYLFHLLLVGRYFPPELRQKVYDFCDSQRSIYTFYSLVVVSVGVIAFRIKALTSKAKVAAVLFISLLASLALTIPLWFSELLLVHFDRYVYFSSAFFYMLVAVLLSYISVNIVRAGLIAFFALCNLRYAVMTSRYWGKSERIITNLLTTIPRADDKIMVLLNLPECFNGTPMIGAERSSEFKLMHNLLRADRKINNEVYDAMAYNMLQPTDGAFVTVVNDSVLRVTLNQWGTWWWMAGQGGVSYENEAYKLDLKDPGHYYELTLKRPAQDYLLLYSVGDTWKMADMGNKGGDQH